MAGTLSTLSPVMFSKASDEWTTPSQVIRDLEHEFGRFTLDPCCRPETAVAPRFHTIEDDGLSHSWAGERVFVNPPYSACAAWMEKAFAESRRAEVVVCLVPARTDSAWWHNYAMRGEVRFIRGRLRFNGAKKDAPFPSVIVVFRSPSAA